MWCYHRNGMHRYSVQIGIEMMLYPLAAEPPRAKIPAEGILCYSRVENASRICSSFIYKKSIACCAGTVAIWREKETRLDIRTRRANGWWRWLLCEESFLIKASSATMAAVFSYCYSKWWYPWYFAAWTCTWPNVQSSLDLPISWISNYIILLNILNNSWRYWQP